MTLTVRHVLSRLVKHANMDTICQEAAAENVTILIVLYAHLVPASNAIVSTNCLEAVAGKKTVLVSQAF